MRKRKGRVGMEGRSSWFCGVGERRTLLGSLRGERRVGRGLVGRVVGYGSMGLLLLLALMLVNPSMEEGSYATCLDGEGENECAVSALSQEVGVTSKTVIALATASQVKLPDVTPTSTGATAYASSKLAVATNSKEGYAIFLQTGTAEGSLTGVTSNMDDVGKIRNTTQTGVALANLETNSYGYALSTSAINDKTVYSHVPTSSTVIYNKAGSVEMGEGAGEYPYGDEYYLAFGTKIGTTLPAGTYAGTVTVSAIANPTTVTSLYDINYMQEMTSDICINTKEHYTKQLIDTRDGKSYWVAKLKDGNCWMTQNLALDLDVNEAGNAVAVSENGKTSVMTPENTDIEEMWNAEGNQAVWNFGKWVNALPLYGQSCGATVKNLESCKTVGFINVDDGWQPVFEARNDTWAFDDSSSYTGIVAANERAKTYDAHYLVGNFYNFKTVTAGTNMTEALSDASGSICPKGWRLPKGGVTSDNDFQKMLSSYGLSGNISNNDYNMLIEPLFLSRSGWYDPYSTSGPIFVNFGAIRMQHTSTSMTSKDEYLFYITNSSVSVRHTFGNHVGLQARCLAR